MSFSQRRCLIASQLSDKLFRPAVLKKKQKIKLNFVNLGVKFSAMTAHPSLPTHPSLFNWLLACTWSSALQDRNNQSHISHIIGSMLFIQPAACYCWRKMSTSTQSEASKRAMTVATLIGSRSNTLCYSSSEGAIKGEKQFSTNTNQWISAGFQEFQAMCFQLLSQPHVFQRPDWRQKEQRKMPWWWVGVFVGSQNLTLILFFTVPFVKYLRD